MMHFPSCFRFPHCFRKNSLTPSKFFLISPFRQKIYIFTAKISDDPCFWSSPTSLKFSPSIFVFPTISEKSFIPPILPNSLPWFSFSPYFDHDAFYASHKNTPKINGNSLNPTSLFFSSYQGRRRVINIGGQKFGSQILGGQKFFENIF